MSMNGKSIFKELGNVRYFVYSDRERNILAAVFNKEEQVVEFMERQDDPDRFSFEKIIVCEYNKDNTE